MSFPQIHKHSLWNPVEEMQLLFKLIVSNRVLRRLGFFFTVRDNWMSKPNNELRLFPQINSRYYYY